MNGGRKLVRLDGTFPIEFKQVLPIVQISPALYIAAIRS